jgi:diacylglycerol kinase (ATP)
LAFRVAPVRDAEAATLATQEALARGDRFLVVAGGDDLLHAVVNGMFEDGKPLASDAVVGVVAGSTPSDFIRTFGLPADPARACSHLEGEGVFAIDAVRARFRTRAGAAAERVFVNLAEAGLGGAIAARTAALPAGLRRMRRFAGYWLGVAAFRPSEVSLRGDRRTWEGRVHDVVVANGQYAGDGYRLSPKSWPSDGYVDVLVMTGPKSDAFTMLPKAVLGEHLPHPNVVEYRAKTLTIDSARPLPLHLDGVPVGTTPASFEVIPEAIRLKI